MKICYVMFDITNRCNFNCRHCYKEKINTVLDLDSLLIADFINQIDQFGQMVKVIFSGGEPLMYANLYELLDRTSKNHHIRINTNAYYLDQHISRLLNYQNLEIQVSLDGFDDNSFFEIRNNHFFQKILDNACLAHKNGLNLFFRTTVTNKTIFHYKHFIDLSEKIGIPMIIRPVVYTGEISQKELAIDYETIHKWLEECKSTGLTKYSGDSIVSSHCPLINDEPVFSTLTVDVCGNVYPCMLLKSKKFYMGNIAKENADSIFLRCKELRKSILDIIQHPKCMDCGFRDRFGDGTCLAACFLNTENCIKDFIL